MNNIYMILNLIELIVSKLELSDQDRDIIEEFLQSVREDLE
jgi:hypothetical protein